jgi:hypothetical protein
VVRNVVGSRKALAVTAMVWVACAPAPEAVAPSAPIAASASAPTPAPSASTGPAAQSTPATPSDVVASNRAPFDACYAQARAKDPALGRTKMEVTFAVGADGRPRTVDLKYRNGMDDAAKDCMRDAALSLQFPASMQGPQTATIVFTPPGP